MKDKVMDALQRFSKAMFIPVLILPIAGILIAVGNLFTNVRLQAVLPFLNNPVTIGFGTLLSGSLNAILGNLGVIFCVGLSVGLANKKKSEAGFISLLAFLVFLNAMNKFMNMRGMLVEGSLSGTGQAMVLGVQVLDMGVFIGLLLGIVVAYVHNRFCETEFNNAFQIYGGTRFVFIVLIPVMVVLAVLFTFVWPYAQAGINGAGRLYPQRRQLWPVHLRHAGASADPHRSASPGLHPVPVHLSGRHCHRGRPGAGGCPEHLLR